MIAPRTLLGLALVASLTLLAGCGSTTPEVDDAVIVRPDPAAKDAPAPAPVPAPTPGKEAPKG
jgi:hypothetical protein